MPGGYLPTPKWTAYLEKIERIKKGITGPGRRHEEFQELVGYLVRVEGKTPKEVEDYIETWLEVGSHKSRDLTGSDAPRCKREMLAGTRKFASKVGRQYRRDLRTGKTIPLTKSQPHTPLFTLTTSTPNRGGDWRKNASKSLLVADRKWLARWVALNPKWSLERQHLELLLGLFRRGKIHHGDEIAVSYKFLERIAGHGTGYIHIPRKEGWRSISCSSAKALKHCAIAAGLLLQVKDHEAGRATIFRFHDHRCA